eukprot:6179835-Pleurochrysis_carterae.AAC.4
MAAKECRCHELLDLVVLLLRRLSRLLLVGFPSPAEPRLRRLSVCGCVGVPARRRLLPVARRLREVLLRLLGARKALARGRLGAVSQVLLRELAVRRVRRVR